MAMVTDPVCGMRIDPDDAAASAEHEGQRSWFCSEACHHAFVAGPELTGDRLTEDELSRRSDSSVDRIRQLVELGILAPGADGRFPRRDVMLARVVAYLQNLGFDAADLGRALESGHLTLGYGTVVKLMGDGVLLHFPDPADAVRASLELVVQAPARGLPPAHIGVNAGPMLYDQGDYFGRTVNVAARIAAQAEGGRVYVGESLLGIVPQEGFVLSELGAFELKGLSEPLNLYEARPVDS